MTVVITKGRKKVIEDWMQDIIVDLQQEMDRRGHNASGKTRQGITRKADQFGGEITAPLHIVSLEHGSRPWKNQYKHPPKWFRNIIQKWLDTKGLDIPAYLIAKKIMQKGNRIFRRGGNSGLITDIITEERTEHLIENIARYEQTEYHIGVQKIVNKTR